MFNVQSLSGEKPHAVPLLTEESLSEVDPKRAGVVIKPPDPRHTGEYFLSRFIEGPSQWRHLIKATDEKLTLMQIAHELGHALSADEVRADIAGMMIYVSETGDTKFLIQWHNARLAKALFSPQKDAIDFRCAVAALKLKFLYDEGQIPFCQDFECPEVLTNIENVLRDLEADVSAYREFREFFQSSNFKNLSPGECAEQVTNQYASFSGPLKNIALRYILAFEMMAKNQQVSAPKPYDFREHYIL